MLVAMHEARNGAGTSTIETALDAVAHGTTQVVLLVGADGSGKTWLLDAARDAARGRGFEVRSGHTSEHESDVPLALFAGVLPHTGRVATGPDRWPLFQSLSDELRRIGASAPVLLALDDLQWADAASLELVDHLVRHPPASPRLLLLATRPGPAARALQEAAGSAAGGWSVVELEAAQPGPVSGVHPLGSVPDTARRLLEAGTLLGDPFSVDTAAAVAELTGEAALAALDELLVRGFVVPARSPRDFAFAPGVRTSAHDSMTTAARLSGHARAAAELARVGAPLVDRARHLAHAAGPGDLASATTLRQAAAQVRGAAPSLAADWLLVAKAAAPAHELSEFTDLAEVLVQSGRLSEALDAAREGLAFGVGDVDTRLRMTLVAASVERQLGQHEAARRRLVRALEDEVQDPPPTTLLGALALSALERGDYGAVADWAARMRDAGPEDRVLSAVADALLAMMQRFAGDLAGSALLTDQAVRAIRNASDEELVTHAELGTAVPWSLLAVERLPDAAEFSRRAADVARSAGNLSAAVPLGLPEVLALGLLGRLEAAEEAAALVEQTARLTHHDQAVQWALWVRAWVLLELGRVPEALAAATESVAVAERLDDSALAIVARTVLGAALLADGQPAPAATLLAAYDLDPSWVCRWSPRLVEALLATGDRVAAARAAERAGQLAAASGLFGVTAAAHRSAALVALAEGELARALQHAETSIEAADRIGAAHDSARAHLLAGRAHPEGDPVGVRHLTEAHRLAQTCGARRTAEEAVRELRRRGHRIGRGGARAPGQVGVASLSPRELEIAALVAQGRTNRDIAGRLFLSEKTIESHLSKAFSKLGVSSRAALAAQVAPELADPTGPSA